jgi:hypothetical protein
MLLRSRDSRKVITRLEPVPTELRVVTTLDPDPACRPGKQSTVGVRLSFWRDAVIRTYDLRDWHGERSKIDIPWVSSA